MGAEIGTVADIVRVHAAKTPDRVVIDFADQEITWARLDGRSQLVRNALARAGVAAGGRIARLDKNGPDYFELLFGAARAGVVLVDVNWRLAPPEVAEILNDAKAEILFVGRDLVAAIESVRHELESIRLIVVLGEEVGEHQSYDQHLGGDGVSVPDAPDSAEDVCLQLYTSGTTGLPKGVMLTNANLFTFLDEVAPRWGLSPDATAIVAMPLFHIGGSGWSLVSMAMGARTVLVREFDPAAVLRLLGTKRVTHSVFVPAMLQMMVAASGGVDVDVSVLRLIVYGAAPITDTVLRASMALFQCEFAQVYGLTETTGAIVQLDPVDHDPDDRPGLLRSCGKPYPWVEVRVVGADGEDVATGEVGELWVRSPQVMVGYWGRPDATAEAITPDGWFKTGDAGYWNDGYLYLHDRVKDMIVSGGENIYPAEVENALVAHPGIADVGVIGVPHDKWGETVKAVVVAAPGATLSATEVMAFARERLAGFKCPTSVDLVDVLPRNPSGKILKRELREPYWAGRERRVN